MIDVLNYCTYTVCVCICVEIVLMLLAFIFSNLVNFMKLVAMVDDDEDMQSVAQEQVTIYYNIHHQ